MLVKNGPPDNSKRYGKFNRKRLQCFVLIVGSKFRLINNYEGAKKSDICVRASAAHAKPLFKTYPGSC